MAEYRDAETPRHQRITNYKMEEDGTISINSKSYYEQLSQELEEREKFVLTSFNTLKKDVEMALDHMLVDGSSKLVLTIEAPSKNKPMRITKRWVTLKKVYPRN